MPDLLLSPLPDLSRPLLDKFYRSHRSPMRLPANGHAWVARCPEIVAALCLTPVRQGHWLTGVFVAPLQRGQGLGRGLIDQAQAAQPGPLWLFCEPKLQAFYQPMGFRTALQLPAELTERLTRYQRHKTLVALVRE